MYWAEYSPRVQVLICAAAACAFACCLSWLPPEQYSIYPSCPVRALLGIDCPGCGMTRALSALLHGNLSKAVASNFCSIPFAVFVLLATALELHSAVRRNCWCPLPKIPTALCLAVAAALSLAIRANWIA